MSKNGKGLFWEYFIGFFILLGVVLVFLEDVARVAAWPVAPRMAIVVVGFLVDLVFSVEFVVRALGQVRAKRFRRWFGAGRGWIDLVSSWPLLLFVSGSLMAGLIFGGVGRIGFLSMAGLLRTTRLFRMGRFLRVFRVFRVLRVLRFLRLLRVLRLEAIWRQVRRKETAGHEAGEVGEGRLDILTAVLVSFVAVLALTPLLPGVFFVPDASLKTKGVEYGMVLEEWYRGMTAGDVAKLEFLRDRLRQDPRVIYFYTGGTLLVDNSGSSEPPEVHLPRRWFFTEYQTTTFQQLRIYYSVKPEEELNARVNLLLETIVVVQMLVLLALPPRRRC